MKQSIQAALAQPDNQKGDNETQTGTTATQRTLLNKVRNVLKGYIANSEVSITPYTFTVPAGQTAIITIQSNANSALISRNGGQVNSIRCSGTCSLYLLSDRSTAQAGPTQMLIDHSY